MVLARIAAVALATLLVAEASAQLPPTPDDKRYPELVAMKTWLEGGLPQARHCAVSAGLFSEASEFYRATRSEPQTLEELRRRHEPTVPARDRAQLQSTLGHVV